MSRILVVMLFHLLLTVVFYAIFVRCAVVGFHLVFSFHCAESHLTELAPMEPSSQQMRIWYRGAHRDGAGPCLNR